MNRPQTVFCPDKGAFLCTVGRLKTRLGRKIRKEPNEVQNRPIVTVVTKVIGNGALESETMTIQGWDENERAT